MQARTKQRPSTPYAAEASKPGGSYSHKHFRLLRAYDKHSSGKEQLPTDSSNSEGDEPEPDEEDSQAEGWLRAQTLSPTATQVLYPSMTAMPMKDRNSRTIPTKCKLG